MDEQWSYVGKKSEPRCVVYPKGTSAIDHATSTILAYVFGMRKDDVFKQLKALLEPFNISRFIYALWVHR